MLKITKQEIWHVPADLGQTEEDIKGEISHMTDVKFLNIIRIQDFYEIRVEVPVEFS